MVVIAYDYPQLSQTYIQTELTALQHDHEVHVLARAEPDYAARSHLPYRRLPSREGMAEAIRAIRPDVLHTHWLQNASLVGWLARTTGVPFTVRAHSFDVLKPHAGGREVSDVTRKAAKWLRDELCLGVLTFPFGRPLLERAGVPARKLVDCFPVVDFARFHDRSPNGTGVMNVGAGTPKKQMDDFLWLASRVPSREFDLYPIGYQTAELREQARRMGSPVRIHEPLEHAEMPAVYKRHGWLVYTASREVGTVGWPLSVAEAQAAGVGVCMPALRPDLREYVGPGAVLYESVSEVVDVVAGPVPEDAREQGFAQARRSDIREHRHLLTDLWRPALPRRSWPRRLLGGLGAWTGASTGREPTQPPGATVRR